MISNIIRNFNRKEDKVKPYLEFKSTPTINTTYYTENQVI